MKKLLLMSIFFTTIFVPFAYNRDKNAKRAFGRNMVVQVVFIGFYWLLLLLVYERL